MGEIEEQRYICKICEKRCVSGKSLGGHMRVHLALISASKKAAKAKAKAKAKSEIKTKIDCGDDDQDSSNQLKGSSANQSNSPLRIEENIEQQNDLGDCDQNNSYELRDNPKKSWRISDSEGVTKKEISCKQCGKEFPSLRALSGHMRSHSTKNKVNSCNTCGKCFDSMRALFGHMKSHSKKSRANDDSADSLSDWESLNSVRKKRSRIRYRINPNPSFTSLNASSCVVSDLGEAQEAARCLMLLSRGVGDFEVKESSDDDSEYFGSKSAFKTTEVTATGGDFVSGKKNWRLENCVYDTVNTFTEKNVSEFGDSSSVLAAEDELMVDLGVSEQFHESIDKLDSANDSCKKTTVSDHDSVLDKNSYRNEAHDVEISKSFENKPEFKCRICDKLLTSQRTLNVHIARHKMKGNIEADQKVDEIKQESEEMGILSLELSKNKEHECPICFKVFSSGQALGGHKRAHYTGFVSEINTRETIDVKDEVRDVDDLFDLNCPVNVDGGSKGNFWWAESGNEHEPLVRRCIHTV